jgi:two-component system CheB/CheR fusion protein
MSILHGVLYLLDPVAPRGHRLPIDFFFRSLAEDQQEQSIGVILSGMGTDGTLGLKALKEKAGVVFVQEPSTAKFDGMPRSAIDAGLADVIAPVESLPEKIIAYLHHVPRMMRIGPQEDEKTHSALEKILILLRMHTRHDFSHYKKTIVYRRVERRMGIHRIDKIASYVRFLQENPQEVGFLFHELLIGVTTFFRDAAMWEHLKTKAMPSLLAGRLQNATLRAWVPGCSTGEEAYSLAIIFQEVIRQLEPSRKFSLQIFATDLDGDAIEKARAGSFPINIAADVSAERLDRFFIHTADGYEVTKSIRDMVVFATQNVAMDPPFTRLDILSCRNLLIYLTSEVQKKLIQLFHYALNPGGILIFGNSETIGGFTDLFSMGASKARVYRRRDAAARATPVEFPSSYSNAPLADQLRPIPTKPIANVQVLADQLILRSHAPAAVLVSDRGDIVYVSGRIGKYFEPAAGKANWNIFAMAREGLRYELANAFQKALKKWGSITVKNLQIDTEGHAQRVELTVERIREPEALKGMLMIVFAESSILPELSGSEKNQRSPIRRARALELERRLQQARLEARTIREEMQTAQEELRSVNEELQSTNEELQSSNEELTTSKEEMQSMNEELQTVNHELQTKVDELTLMNNDFSNLLNSTDIATLFLDASLYIRRFTKRTTEITRLLASDLGRPITDLSSELFYPELAKDAKDVLRSLASVERQVSTAAGRWYAVRVLPYRTLENRIVGVVITFTDITVAKTLEAEYHDVHAELEKRFAAQAKELENAKEDLRTEQVRTKSHSDDTG